MLTQALLVAVSLLAAVAGEGEVLINDLVERQMDLHNRILTPRYGLVPFRSLSLGDIQLSSGVQIGMNSLHRTGDCFAVQGPNSVAYKYQVGFRLLVLAFGNIRIQGKSSSGFVRVRNNSLQINYTVHNYPSCNVTLEEYKFIDFSNIEFASSDPDLDGTDIAGHFNGRLLDLANVILSEDKKAFEAHLQPLCRHSPLAKAA